VKPDTRAQLETRLRYYEDLGIRSFYRNRSSHVCEPARAGEAAPAPAPIFVETPVSLPDEAPTMAKAKIISLSGAAAAASLFDIADRIDGDTLERIQADLGDDCRRCKLCRKRKTIVFGDGHPRAQLMFVGEGPGADEDEQGLPFVGRAGKLLTQMIEAMGLQRSDVYICNVVKCRPPDNRVPEKDEVAECSPFLFRQIAVIQPKVVVALGASAVGALLGAPVAITKIHGEWVDWRGTKLMPVYHPAYLLRNPPAKPDAWKDLQKVMAYLGLPMPPKKK